MIEVAFDNLEEVNSVIDILLSKKMAASCQVIESDSSWNWKGNRENSKEYLLHIKTKKSQLKKIYNIIEKIHSYECFEFAIYEIDSINKNYINWIDKEVEEGN